MMLDSHICDEDDDYHRECRTEIMAWDYAFVARKSYDETYNLITASPWLTRAAIVMPATQYVQRRIAMLDIEEA